MTVPVIADAGRRIESVQIERYLQSLFEQGLSVIAIRPLTGAPQDAKSFGYGEPIRVDYELAGQRKSAVLHTMSPGQFGHERMPDRAAILLWSHQAFNRLPCHVRSYDVGQIKPDGTLISAGDASEFCLLTEYAEGEPYANDLQRIRNTGELTPIDWERADALCDYLTGIHKEKVNSPGLYLRRTRELVGHGECIMGLADSYPPHPLFTAAVLEDIEHRAVQWRWRLKGLSHRLNQVHGDFHPWNILFASDTDFRLLDRSRGELGDSADDVTCLTLNYLFFSLQRSGRLEGPFESLFLRFWDRYLERTHDREILEVAAPYFAFRALVMASPVWYPKLSELVRERLLNFILAVFDQPKFDPREVNKYCGS